VFSYPSGVRPPPCSPLFPYTTLFRSAFGDFADRAERVAHGSRVAGPVAHEEPVELELQHLLEGGGRGELGHAAAALGKELNGARSEEHTSELQSRENLVCRLLLEKKK